MKKLILIFLVLCCVQNAIAQEVVRIKMDVNIEINELSESENYVCVQLRDKINDRMSAILFDKKGKEILRVFDPVRSTILLAEFIEKSNTFIVISQGYEGYQEIEQRNDLIQAIDPNTKKIIWQAESNAEFYEISPDKKYLLTKAIPDDDRRGSLEIIDLSNGSKLFSDPLLSNFRAIWLDSENIALVYNGIRIIQPDEKIRNEFREWDVNVLEKHKKLRELYDERVISKDEFDKKWDELLKERLDKSNQYAKLLNPKRDKETITVTHFNIFQKKVTESKKIYDINNNRIVLDYNDGFLGSLVKDDLSNIYIHCVDYFSEPTVYDYFIKINSSFDLVWQTERIKRISFARYIINQIPYHAFLKEGITYYIGYKDGKVEEFKRSELDFQDIPSIQTVPYAFRKVIKFESVNTCKIDFQNNSIIINRGISK